MTDRQWSPVGELYRVTNVSVWRMGFGCEPIDKWTRLSKGTMLLCIDHYTSFTTNARIIRAARIQTLVFLSELGPVYWRFNYDKDLASHDLLTGIEKIT